MDLLRDFKPTSKTQTRQFCIWYCEGNVEKANELYKYFTDGLDLPDQEPAQPSRMQNVKEGVEDVVGFIRDNGDDIMNAFYFVKDLFTNKASVGAVADALPKIN